VSDVDVDTIRSGSSSIVTSSPVTSSTTNGYFVSKSESLFSSSLFSELSSVVSTSFFSLLSSWPHAPRNNNINTVNKLIHIFFTVTPLPLFLCKICPYINKKTLFHFGSKASEKQNYHHVTKISTVTYDF